TEEDDVNPPEIVVGVDGSPASRAAVTWAAVRAARQHMPLLVAHVYDWRKPGARMAVGGAYAAAAREHAEATVTAAIADAKAAAPKVQVRGEAILGHPGPALIGLSAEAGLMVVGSRGHGGFASLLLGSVSQQVATHSIAPVVVVRGRPDASAGPIVVGVDGSPAASHALSLAFAEATAHDRGVVAIRAYTPAQPPWGAGIEPYVEDPEERHATELKVLIEDVAPWRDKHPDVHVECVAASGHTAEVLIGVSATASLVVVGTRGHGGFAGLLLGSVSQQLLHHAECPVLIAHAGVVPA
ncbi:MAG TPA: universal stress protein, partial [Micromonosporaceae bacterium]